MRPGESYRSTRYANDRGCGAFVSQPRAGLDQRYHLSLSEECLSQPLAAPDRLLASIRPELNEGIYVFSSVPLDTDISALAPLATFREREGLTLIVDETVAHRAGLSGKARRTAASLPDLY
jgi:ACT domain